LAAVVRASDPPPPRGGGGLVNWPSGGCLAVSSAAKREVCQPLEARLRAAL